MSTTKKSRHGPGRPALGDQDRRDDWHIRASANELERWQAAADILELSLSQWVRYTLDRAARRAGKR